MASGSFASGQPPQPSPHQPPPPPPPPPEQQQQQQQPYAMDMGLGYPSAAAAAAAMGEAYRAQGNVFGRLEYQPQAEENRQPQRRRRQQGGGGSAPVQAAPQASMGPPANKHQHHMGQFGILAPTPVPLAHAHGSMAPVMGQQQPALHYPPGTQHAGVAGAGVETAAPAGEAHGKLGGKIVIDPPDLQAWREKLFNVDEMIVLTQEQFETYFPHVDNVYSHRSTQKYKRKPFVSHYWDCRMKGRPPGTPKTEDPNKKRRRRSARERDLCDVKIKITEYFPSSEPLQLDGSGGGPEAAAAAAVVAAGYHGQRFWTVQRVNGNGGNGKGDGVAGPHKHTLAKSDEIKKNSVQRHVAAQEREAKRAQPAPRRATGAAAATARKHAREGTGGDIKLYAACYCPFSQRVWIALEAKGVPYQYCEADPHRKPAPPALLETSPKGQVPAIRQGSWACAESALEDVDSRVPLLPSDGQLKANCRFWINHASSPAPLLISCLLFQINTDLLAAFYALLRNTDLARQADLVARLQSQLDRLAQAADERGPYFLGLALSLVDVHLAPFAVRLRTLMHSRRGWPAAPAPATSRWARWLDALERDPHVKATTSADDLYADTADMLINDKVLVPL
ncbi:hypothetical protein V2A60_001099 [Cordyceps javanica]